MVLWQIGTQIAKDGVRGAPAYGFASALEIDVTSPLVRACERVQGAVERAELRAVRTAVPLIARAHAQAALSIVVATIGTVVHFKEASGAEEASL